MIASSGNGITERNASYDTDSHDKSDTANNAEDVIGSLLAGVSLSTSSYSKDDLGVDWSSPSPSCNDIHHRAKVSTVKSNIGNGGQRVPSRTQLLFGTDIQDLHDLDDDDEPITPVRKESIDLFLSQSPSQTLGEEVLQLQQTLTDSNKHAKPNSAFVDAWNNRMGVSPSFSGEMRQPKPVQASYGRRRMDSPPNSVTGTTVSSRSVSPSIFGGYNNERGGLYGNIQTFQGYPGGTETHRTGASMSTTNNNTLLGINNMQFQQSNPVMSPMLQYPPSKGMDQFFQQNQEKIPPQQQLHHQQSPFTNQLTQAPICIDQFMQHSNPHIVPSPSVPQVLYMAVPTPDGRGQMLQAVHMLHVAPGGGSVAGPVTGSQSYVLPSSFHQEPDNTNQPVMVLPTSISPNFTSPSMQANRSSQSWEGPQNYSRPSELKNPFPLEMNRANAAGGIIPADDYVASNISRIGSTGAGSPTHSLNGSCDVIASLYSAAQRPPLESLLGHVRRLSRDQVGCRLLQQALDEEGPMAATVILNEGISFWGEAMIDPFGNYLFQKILEKITPQERIMLIQSVAPRLVNASLNLHGTRSVQKVVELCAMDESQFPEIRDSIHGNAAEILTAALSPAAARLCIDSHGNHVIQRILLKLGHSHSRFVFDAVANSVSDVARHRHGCCVIQRCLDSPPTEARSHLVRRIVQKSLELMQDAYGNYVVQYVLDVCGDEDVHAVCESVAGKVCLLAIQKFSSNVMEKCLERASDRIKAMYLQELSDTERIRELMMDPFGNYVVQRALSVATHSQAINLVEAMRPHLITPQPGSNHGQRNGGMRNTAGGRRIMAKICRRFPNFTPTAIGPPEELYSQSKGQQRKHPPPPASIQPSSSMTNHPHQVPRYGSNPNQVHNVYQGNVNGIMNQQPYFDPVHNYYDSTQNDQVKYHPHM